METSPSDFARCRIELPARGGTMAALDFGPAERPIEVIFSHANGFNARTYRSILAPLAPPMRILALDLRGHGRTELPTNAEGRSTWNDIAEDLCALLEVIGAQDVILAGHSLGGTASLLAASRAPQRIRGLLLFDPVILSKEAAQKAREGPINSPLAEGARRRRTLFASRGEALAAYSGRGAFKSLTEPQLADYVADGLKERPDGAFELACSTEWEASNFVSHGHDAWAALLGPGPPVRILQAEHGSTCAALNPCLDEVLASGRVSIDVAPGATHLLPMERPDLVRDEIKRSAAAQTIKETR